MTKIKYDSIEQRLAALGVTIELFHEAPKPENVELGILFGTWKARVTAPLYMNKEYVYRGSWSDEIPVNEVYKDACLCIGKMY